MRDNTQKILEVSNLSFSYQADKRGDEKVLHDICFDICQGEFLCLLGPSGCGKTTLLRLISGLESASRSHQQSLKFKDTTINIGMVFQDLALFPHMNVKRNIGFALRHLPRAQRNKRIDEMLDLVDLSDKKQAFPHALSGGQKQRLALARALAVQPDIILLDEPFAAQDISLRVQIRDDIMHILRRAGVAAILVTHDPEEAMQFADRLVVMNKGKIEQVGAPFEVYNNPKNSFVASFFGQANHLTGRVENGGVQTNIGFIPAPNFAEQTAVNIIIRPEALKLSSHDPSIDHHAKGCEHAHGVVSESQYIGAP